jgi:hypothetical protein
MAGFEVFMNGRFWVFTEDGVKSTRISCGKSLVAEIRASNMEHVDLAGLDRKEYAITNDYRLPNLLIEFIIFRRKRKRFRDCR